MDMINIIASTPADLLPILPNRSNGRPPPSRTPSYLLLPRADALMVDPPPLMACLTQAEPFRTSARFDIRRDGYFMDDLRNLARSTRGTEAPFAHPSIVTTAEYTVQSAATAMARARHSWAQEEPAPILQPMPAQNRPQPSQHAHSGNQPSPLSSSSTDASTSTPTTNRPYVPPTAQQQNSAPQGTTPSATPHLGTRWFGVYEDASDQDEGEENDPTDMDTANT